MVAAPRRTQRPARRRAAGPGAGELPLAALASAGRQPGGRQLLPTLVLKPLSLLRSLYYSSCCLQLPLTMPCLDFVLTWHTNPQKPPVVSFWRPVAPAGGCDSMHSHASACHPAACGRPGSAQPPTDPSIITARLPAFRVPRGGRCAGAGAGAARGAGALLQRRCWAAHQVGAPCCSPEFGRGLQPWSCLHWLCLTLPLLRNVPPLLLQRDGAARTSRLP